MYENHYVIDLLELSMFRKFFSKNKDDTFSIPSIGLTDEECLVIIRKSLEEQQRFPKKHHLTKTEIKESVRSFEKAFMQAIA